MNKFWKLITYILHSTENFKIYAHLIWEICIFFYCCNSKEFCTFIFYRDAYAPTHHTHTQSCYTTHAPAWECNEAELWRFCYENTHVYKLRTSKKAQPSLNTLHKSVWGIREGHYSINGIQNVHLLKVEE